MCFRCGLGILPPLLVVLFVVTFITTYLVSWRHDNTPWVPIISNIGDHSPEKNIFGQLFNVCSFLALVVAFVRYLQLRHDADWNENDRPLLLKLNKVAFVFGVLAALGGSVVSNFQEDDVRCMRIAGVSIVFTCGLLYCWVQSLISYKMKTCGLITSTLLTVRFFCVFALSACFVAWVAATVYAKDDWMNSNPSRNGTHHRWNPKDEYYVSHVVGDVSEWLVALFMLLYVFTFCGEFKSVRMKVVVSRRFQNPMPLITGMESEESLRAPLLF